jgi:predicted nuclease of predicted toxin-antitoxin system
MKILIDMNLSPLWAGFLCAHGHAGIHWSEVGSARATDREILDYAAANGMVVLTHDLDFGLLLAARRARGPSVIQVRTQDVLPSAVGATVLRAVEASLSHLQRGALVTVDPARQRIRLLPI